MFLRGKTAASGTTQYLGWRTSTLNRDDEPLDPRTVGYPATDAFLEDRALEPEQWSATNADLGLYSTPSYMLEVEVRKATDRCVGLRVSNDLARDLAGAVTTPLEACARARLENGEVVWQRFDGDRKDVSVAFQVGARESLDVTVRCTPRLGRVSKPLIPR